MYLTLVSRFSVPFSSFALVHMRLEQLHWKRPFPSSLSFSSSSRSSPQLMAPSMEIKQSTQLQINCF
jgi:hypothetical protein